MPSVVLAIQQDEIFRSIIGSDPVLMMDMLCGQQWPSEVLFHDPSVL